VSAETIMVENMETVFVGPAPRLAVSVAGDGPFVLFLHGIRGNRRNWSAQVEAFSGRYRAAAWDARGYGDSDDHPGALQFEYFSGDVLRVLEHFGAKQAHLVGLSMGGRIARNVALRYPERVKSLSLVSTTPGFDAMSTDEVRRFVTERKSPPTPESVRRLLGSRAEPGAFEALWQSVSAVRDEPYRKTLEASVAQDRGAPIEEIRVPTLVVSGDEDSVYPASQARELARRIPGAELAMIEGAGHLVNLEQPKRFNAVVMEFVRKQEKKS
jgi:3-oxoadipate enol-lactonase